MKPLRRFPLLLPFFVLFSLAILALGDENASEDLPEAVVDALEQEFPEFVIVEVESKGRSNGMRYILEILFGDQEWEISIRPDGDILKAKREDDEDGDEDDDSEEGDDDSEEGDDDSEEGDEGDGEDGETGEGETGDGGDSEEGDEEEGEGDGEEGEGDGDEGEGDGEEGEGDGEEGEGDGEEGEGDGEEGEGDGEEGEGDGEEGEGEGEGGEGETDGGDEGDGDEFSTLPDDVASLLEEAVPGIEVRSFRIKGKSKGMHYEIEGFLDGEPVKVKVFSNGRIIVSGGEEGEEGDGEEGDEGEEGEEGDGGEGDQGEEGDGGEGDQGEEGDGGEGDQGEEGDGGEGDQGEEGDGEEGDEGEEGEEGDVDPDNGCTHGSGYWKNHSSKKSSKRDAAWDVVGEDTPFFESGVTYLEAISHPPRGDAYFILAKHYIAAVLNEANGAVPGPGVVEALEAAADWFEANETGQRPNSDNGQFAIALAEILDSFNRGLIGATGCDGEGDPADEDDSLEDDFDSGDDTNEGDPGEGDAGEGEGDASEGEGDASEGEGDASEGEGDASEGEGDAGEGDANEGESNVVEEPVTPTPLEVGKRELPEQAKAIGLRATLELRVLTEPGKTYRFQCLNAQDKWEPLGGKFRGDGTEQTVRVPLGRRQHCQMFRVRIASDEPESGSQ